MIVKPADLKIGDVVCFANNRFPFGDYEVVREADGGFYLRRAYIDCDTHESGYEENFWQKGSNFEFKLLKRDIIAAVPNWL